MESKQATQKQLFTQSELVAYLGISQKDVQLLTELPDSQGYTSELPHLKIGETFYYSKKSIDNWLVDMDTSVIHPPYE